jgi:hypothetical protein
MEQVSHAVISSNPAAMRLLMAYPERLTGRCFPTTPTPTRSKLPTTLSELTGGLSSNPSAKWLLLNNQDKICWFNVSKNPSMVDFLKEHEELINWNTLCLTRAPTQ